MTILAYREKLKNQGHGGTYITAEEANMIVLTLLQNDFLNVICYIAPEIQYVPFDFSPISNFEQHYKHKGYHIDYSLLNDRLQERLQIIDVAIAEINSLFQEVTKNKMILPAQIQKIFEQCLTITSLCCADHPVELLLKKQRQLFNDFQKITDQYQNPQAQKESSADDAHPAAGTLEQN